MSALAAVHAADDGDTELRAALIGLVPVLAEPRLAIEQVFLEMGRDLLGCSALLNEITAAHEGLSGEFDSDTCDRAASHLQSIRDQAERLATFQSGEQEHIVQLGAITNAVAVPLCDLRQAVRAIKLITVNARIAAASIMGQKHDFDAFTGDMRSLGASVEAAVGAFAGALDELAENIARARAANDAFAATHEDTIAQISGRLAANQDIVASHRTRAKTKAGEQRVLNGQIQMSVASAVGAMQIGDITRQRVEHVEQALQALAEHVVANPPEASSRAENTVAAACHLQALQLDETLGAFDREILGLAGSLRELAGDAASVLAAGNEEAETLLSASGTAFGAMIDDLRKIRASFAEFGRTRGEIEKTAREVERSVAVMVGHLDAVADVEHNIRLVSLNMTIQCSRLGVEGRALRVVAQELRDLARTTVSTAAAIMEGLRDAEAVVGRLGDGASCNVTQEVVALADDAGAAIELFEAVTGRLHMHVAAMTAAGPRVIRQLAAANEAVSGRREFTSAWHMARTRVSSMAPLDVQSCAMTDVDAEFFARLRRDYTMDFERRVHDALLGTAAEQGSAAADGEEGDDKVDDRGGGADVDDLLF